MRVETAEDKVMGKLLQYGCVGIRDVAVSEMGALKALAARGKVRFGIRFGKLGYYLVSSLREVG